MVQCDSWRRKPLTRTRWRPERATLKCHVTDRKRMSTPKNWAKASFPGFTDLAERLGMAVAREAQGPRGEWYVQLQSSGLDLFLGSDFISGPGPEVSIRPAGQKYRVRADTLLKELGIWDAPLSYSNEREMAKV